MALIDDFKTRFPEISATTVDRLLPLYETTFKCYYNSTYGVNDCDDEIILVLIAHLIETNRGNADGTTAPAPLQSESVDGVAVTYSTAQYKDGTELWWYSTPYGQMFQMLIQKNIKAYFA